MVQLCNINLFILPPNLIAALRTFLQSNGKKGIGPTFLEIVNLMMDTHNLSFDIIVLRVVSEHDLFIIRKYIMPPHGGRVFFASVFAKKFDHTI